MRVSLLPAAALLLTLSLTACATPVAMDPGSPDPDTTTSPSPEATGEPAPDPVAEAEIDTIVLEAEGFAFLADGEVVSRASAADAEATIAALTEVLGEPVVEQFPAGECSSDTDNYRWGEVLQLDDATDDFLGDYSARLFGTQYPTEAGATITLSAVGGEQVGDDITGFIAEQDPLLFEGFEEQGVVILEQGWSDLSFPAGVAAFTESGVIRNIGMPISVNSGLGC